MLISLVLRRLKKLRIARSLLQRRRKKPIKKLLNFIRKRFPWVRMKHKTRSRSLKRKSSHRLLIKIKRGHRGCPLFFISINSSYRLEPFFPFKEEQHYDRDRCHDTEYTEITVFPVEFRKVVEIHSIN